MNSYDIPVNKQTYKDILNLSTEQQQKFYDITVNLELLSFFEEIGELTHQERLVRGKEKIFKKLFEEIGEYAVASLGDKEVTESPRQELVDCLIMLFSLFILEGGSIEYLTSYGKVKLDKWKEKIK